MTAGGPVDLGAAIIDAWRTSARVTAYLVEHLPAPVWNATVPGAPRRTVCMIAGHLHNSRCAWLKTLGSEHGIATPASVDRRRVTRSPAATAPAPKLFSTRTGDSTDGAVWTVVMSSWNGVVNVPPLLMLTRPQSEAVGSMHWPTEVNGAPGLFRIGRQASIVPPVKLVGSHNP